jgi:acyl-CoA synthetase (NDP forming)
LADELLNFRLHMRPIDLITKARQQGRLSLSEADAKTLLAGFGISVPAFAVLPADGDVPGDALQGVAAPYAAKVLSPDILHKSDAGGVVLGVPDLEGVRRAVRDIGSKVVGRGARIDGYLVESMCEPGTEVVIGGLHDTQFGPMVMVGLGGIFVEILGDVAFRLCPVDRKAALEMLDDLRGGRILDGARGKARASREAIGDLLVKIGGEDGVLMQLAGEIAELDLNPVIVTSTSTQVADARVILAKPVVRTTQPGVEADPLKRFDRLFSPRTVAVVGASSTSKTIANTFIARLREFGFEGPIYPIHPSAEEVEGLKCYRSLGDTPETIDYAYVAVGARHIPDLLRGAQGRVRFAQVISSGFGEVAEGVELQADLVRAARESGCRLLGPNCLGIYSPRGRINFSAGASRELGTAGVVSQSGGLGTDIIKRGQWRGLRFSGLVTVGNSADVGPLDLLEFYLADPQTRVVGMYLEDVKDGRRFFDILRNQSRGKPVVVLRGGRSIQGRLAAASHTGALASDERAWEAVSRQTGCVLVKTVDAFIDALLAFQCLDPRPEPTNRVVLFGNGGGTGVLAADAFAERGLLVEPLQPAAIERLEALKLPPGTSVVNPIDTPVATLQAEDGRIAGRILSIVYEHSRPDALVLHINLAAFVGRGGDPVDALIQAAIAVKQGHAGGPHFVLVLRADGSPELEERRRHYRAAAVAARIPVYDELEPVADALFAIRWAEERRTQPSRAGVFECLV